MSLSRRGTATPMSTPTLTTLPQDVLLHILDFMHPTQIALYSQLCTLTHFSSLDSTLWATIARRHLGISPTTPPTPASISSLAQSLISKWWLVTGAFVAGVPVHFRRGFTEIHARGGIEVPLDESGDSAYVWGGKHKKLAVPASMPGMELDFYLDAAGPFPMGGMRVRILHAAEEGERDEERQYIGMPVLPRKPDVAKVRIRVNEEEDREVCLEPSGRFEVMEFVVSADELRTKPRMNRVFIEYERSSAAAYWIKEVLLMPCVMPMPKVEESKLVFEVAEEGGRRRGGYRGYQDGAWVGGGENEERDVEGGRGRTHESTPVRTPPRTREGSPRVSREMPGSPSRRMVSLGEVDLGKVFAPDVGGGKVKLQKYQRAGKTPKHLYHHNHYRSPRGGSRGGAPVSPKAKGR